MPVKMQILAFAFAQFAQSLADDYRAEMLSIQLATLDGCTIYRPRYITATPHTWDEVQA